MPRRFSRRIHISDNSRAGEHSPALHVFDSVLQRRLRLGFHVSLDIIPFGRYLAFGGEISLDLFHKSGGCVMSFL